MRPPPPASARFVTTRWSVVLAAGARATPQSEAALETLCSTYWYPLYAYARRCGRDADAAQDSVQAFFARLLANEGIAVADPERGRFRTFLLTSFRRFMASEAERAAARKRGGGRAVLSLDAADPEARYALEPAHDLSPDRVFLRNWTLALLETVLGRVRRAYEQQGKGALFDALKDLITGDAGDAEGHRARAEALGMREGAVRVAAHRLRRRYREALRDEIRQTLYGSGVGVPDQEIDQEIRTLFEAL